jgi:uncharacterized tellurite resistance protein B-like protein
METELSEPIQLTPMLSLTVALLYMMTADGEIEEHESSQLQAVVGGNEDALDLAMEYVETVPLSQFLAEAPEQLNNEDRLCILCNVCDSIMADGQVNSAELALFTQMSNAFGVSSQTFEPYFKAIEFKNKKSILGTYSAENLNAVVIPAHLAMAAGIVYMMSVDGNIAKEEIGQLKLMIGEFEGLQTAAMKYVRNFKMSQFLKESTPYLNQQQKLLILTVIFDAMQSDGKVDEKELSLFETIQKAYGIPQDAFKSLEHALTTKNIKPFGLDVVDPKSMHKRRSKRKPHADGGMFSIGRGKKAAEAIEQRHFNEKTGEWEEVSSASHAGNIVHRTLDSNIKDVSEGFKNQADVNQMANNAQQKERKLKLARHAVDPNLQHAEETAGKANIQNVEDAATKANIQNVQGAAASANIQNVQGAAAKTNSQGMGQDSLTDNLQAIGVDVLKERTQDLPTDQAMHSLSEMATESRLESLQDDINQVHEKLDQVKPTKQWVRLDALFTGKDDKKKKKEARSGESSKDNIQGLATASVKDNKQPLANAAEKENKQPVASAAVKDNKQPLANAAEKENKQPVASAPVKDNKQPLANAAEKDNKQPVASAAVKDNIQALSSSSYQDVTAALPPQGSSLGDILHTRLAPPEHVEASPIHPEETDDDALSSSHAVSAEQQAIDDMPTQDAALADLDTSSLEEEDGGIRLRTLFLVLAINLPLVVFAYGWIYPTMVCQGQSQQWQTFSPDSDLSASKVMEDQQIFERHLLQLRRGEININNQRFPLYKELNPHNHFAQQTKDGFKGSYSNHVVDSMNYAFQFNKATGELNINTNAVGVRFFDGESGRVEVFSNFKGQCENRWF